MITFCFFSLLEKSCNTNEFPCANGACIAMMDEKERNLMCNGVDDCGDNSDETTVCSGTLNHSF